MSPHTFPGEGEPLRVPPSVEKDPAGAAVPQCAAASRRPQTDTATLRQGCAGGNLVLDPEISEVVSDPICETQPGLPQDSPEMTQARAEGRQFAAGVWESEHIRPERLRERSTQQREANFSANPSTGRDRTETLRPGLAKRGRRAFDDWMTQICTPNCKNHSQRVQNALQA